MSGDVVLMVGKRRRCRLTMVCRISPVTALHAHGRRFDKLTPQAAILQQTLQQ
jgi:hypothetical protein